MPTLIVQSYTHDRRIKMEMRRFGKFAIGKMVRPCHEPVGKYYPVISIFKRDQFVCIQIDKGQTMPFMISNLYFLEKDDRATIIARNRELPPGVPKAKLWAKLKAPAKLKTAAAPKRTRVKKTKPAKNGAVKAHIAKAVQAEATGAGSQMNLFG